MKFKRRLVFLLFLFSIEVSRILRADLQLFKFLLLNFMDIFNLFLKALILVGVFKRFSAFKLLDNLYGLLHPEIEFLLSVLFIVSFFNCISVCV